MLAGSGGRSGPGGPGGRSGRAEWLVWGIGAAAVFWLSALLLHRSATPATAYFNELADAFRHGRLHLSQPASTHDLTLHDGRWYVPFPPLPALLLLPFVSTIGLTHTNTVLCAAVLGGLDAALMRRLLARLADAGVVGLRPSAQRWLTLAYALGSVHWTIATQGSVWFLAHLAAAVFVLGALNAAAARRAVLGGALLGIGCLARPTALPMALAVVGVCVATRSDAQWRAAARVGALVVVPAAAVASLLLVYNRMRFGSFTEFGYRAENVADKLAGDLARYGQFHLHFVKRNVWAMLLSGPTWSAERATVVPDPEGMSILLTTPLLAYALVAPWRRRLVRWCGAAALLMCVPLLTYYNTGWYQFGYRFSLDFLPAALLLVATRFASDGGRVGVGSVGVGGVGVGSVGVGVGVDGVGVGGAGVGGAPVPADGRTGSLSRLAVLLVLAGVLVNLWGMAWFNGR